MHNDPKGGMALGTSGAGIGAWGIKNGVVLEFDTYDNDVVDAETIDEISGSPDHISLWKTDSGGYDTGTNNFTSVPTYYINEHAFKDDSGTPINFEDGIWRDVLVKWDAERQELSYTFAGKTYTSSEITRTGVFNGDNVYFGFTGSTGDESNLQQVRMGTFTGTLVDPINAAPVVDLNSTPTSTTENRVTNGTFENSTGWTTGGDVNSPATGNVNADKQWEWINLFQTGQTKATLTQPIDIPAVTTTSAALIDTISFDLGWTDQTTRYSKLTVSYAGTILGTFTTGVNSTDSGVWKPEPGFGLAENIGNKLSKTISIQQFPLCPVAQQ